MEADDLGTYVVKWRGAGQGVKVLVAEVVCGELARALGLPVPALVTVDVAAELAVGEPDAEVQELMQRSAGRNLGLDYLPGALDFEAGADGVDPRLAGQVLWFDALVGSVDRRGRWLPAPFAARGEPALVAGAAPSGRGDAAVTSKDTFEYAVLRVVPRVERGEALNAGVLVYCRQRDFLGSRVHLDLDRLRALDPTADVDAIGRALQAAADVCAASPEAGAAGREALG